MRTHVFHDRDDGLRHCKVCGGGEGSLPTECPGFVMPGPIDSAVMAGAIDFFGGRWIVYCANGKCTQFHDDAGMCVSQHCKNLRKYKG